MSDNVVDSGCSCIGILREIPNVGLLSSVANPYCIFVIGRTGCALMKICILAMILFVPFGCNVPVSYCP